MMDFFLKNSYLKLTDEHQHPTQSVRPFVLTPAARSARKRTDTEGVIPFSNSSSSPGLASRDPKARVVLPTEEHSAVQYTLQRIVF